MTSFPRVLHVVGAMNRGGAETMLMNLYRQLNRERLQFDFLEFVPGVSDYAREIESLGGRILKIEWSQHPLRARQTADALAQVMHDSGPYCAVHSHVLFANGLVLAGARKAGIEFRVSHSHNTSDVGRGPVAWGYRAMARSAIRRRSTALTACSNDAGNYLYGARLFAARGVVIPNAVDTSRFRPLAPSDREERRRVLGVPKDRLILASVARLEPVKNHQFLLDVAKELNDRGVDFLMLWVGTGSLLAQLESQVVARGLQHRIKILGLREDVESILQSCDAVLMPSLFEGLPVALVEAQATGVPCLVSDSVTPDADLGLDLFRQLPASDAAAWASVIEAGLPYAPQPDQIVRALAVRGYDLQESLDRLLTLYPCGSIGEPS